MTTCTTYWRRILEQIKKGISPEPTSKADLEKRMQNLAVRDIILLKDDCHQNQWPMARIVDIDADAKNGVRSVTLRVSDKKGGPSQILRRPITKLVLLVENELDSPTDGAITKIDKTTFILWEAR